MNRNSEKKELVTSVGKALCFDRVPLDIGRKVLLFLILALVPSFAQAELMLFSDDNTFHGCLDCGKYNTDSVCNR